MSKVENIVATRGVDISGLRTGCSSLRCYEPLFGYQGERIHSTLKIGATSEVHDGRFNLNHPGCLLYPEYFHCKAWDRIPADDGANFAAFREGRVPSWGVPRWQTVSLGINFFCIFALMVSSSLISLGVGRRRADSESLKLPPQLMTEGAEA